MNNDKFIGKWLNPYDSSLNAYVGRWPYHDINLIARDIVHKLNITQNDRVLELCCGNGQITKIVEGYCREVYAVDFSHILINQAKEKSSTPKIHYYLDDVLNIDRLFQRNFFDKTYCYFSFQFFNKKRGKKLIDLMVKHTKKNGSILIGDIPNIRKKSCYYNSERKKIYLYVMNYVQRILRIIKGKKGQDSLGWWWDPSYIKEICRKLNVKCQIIEQDKKLPHSHYRFDVLIQV